MRDSATTRLIVMGTLAILLLVPLTWVKSIVSERALRRTGAITEVSGTWGGPQTIAGPVLVIPYAAAWTDKDGRAQRSVARAFLLPRTLQIDGQVATEVRQRGIFSVPVYRATLTISGSFVRPELDWVRPVPDGIDWDRASVQIGLGDPRGIARRAALRWRGGEIPLAGGADQSGLIRTGLRATVPSLGTLPAGADLPFALTLELNGTCLLYTSDAADE